MRFTAKPFYSPLMIATALAFVSITAVAAESTTTKTTKTTTNPDGSKTVEETTTTKTTEKAEAEKEDFKAKVQNQLDTVQAQIDSLKKDASTASSEAKASAEKKIAVLEKKRDEISADLSKMTDTSGRAWTKFKSGLSKAVGELQDGYQQAKKEFSKDEAKAQKANQ